LRVLTAINLALWIVIFAAWVPYTLGVGWSDAVSVEVRWILSVTAALLLFLGFLRVRRHRPVFGFGSRRIDKEDARGSAQ